MPNLCIYHFTPPFVSFPNTMPKDNASTDHDPWATRRQFRVLRPSASDSCRIRSLRSSPFSFHPVNWPIASFFPTLTSVFPDVFLVPVCVLSCLDVFISTSSSCLIVMSYFYVSTPHYSTIHTFPVRTPTLLPYSLLLVCALGTFFMYLKARCFLPNGGIVFLSFIHSTC
ncbi:hypothetical protein EDB84DRAFT_884455 [Lactarius hengduanensis]|nr:hypothetical protein EDB84DRAFT_884455 [Lactarius hengduanensis]KAH9036969.1 hypothetical protein EDB85DRAFT_673086 [Lactarius pseudohatsudake]